MKYLIFGTGDYYERYKDWFAKEDIAALLDNSPQKQNTKIDGIRVMAPEDGVKLSFDCIVVLSFYVKDMKRQLKALGVEQDRIFHFYDLYKLPGIKSQVDTIRYFGEAREMVEREAENKVLLLSQDLTLGGPAIALLHVARVLQKKGYQTVYASMLDGPLREKLSGYGIPVIVDRRLQIGTMEETSWSDNFSVILCNTINFYVFLSQRNINIPVIWWLHDSLFFYDGVDKDLLRSIDRTNLHIVSVGPIPQRAMRIFLPSLPIGRLLYGVEDNCQMTERAPRSREKTVFAVIGYIEARKGQDILIEAIGKLPAAIRRRAVFYLVGQDTSLMAQEIRKQIQDIPEVILTGVVGRTQIDNLLSQTDMLICPSREDPMPTVAAEAMMHSVPCLLSDAVGTAEYIHNRKDGMLFPSEDVCALSGQIEWCISHTDLLADMGRAARKIYEAVFSMEAMEREVLKIMETAVNCSDINPLMHYPDGVETKACTEMRISMQHKEDENG